MIDSIPALRPWDGQKAYLRSLPGGRCRVFSSLTPCVLNGVLPAQGVDRRRCGEHLHGGAGNPAWGEWTPLLPWRAMMG